MQETLHSTGEDTEAIWKMTGMSVSVKQSGSIAEARKEAAKAIKQEQPRYNEKEK